MVQHEIDLLHVNEPDTLDFRLQPVRGDHGPFSLWHDLPLFHTSAEGLPTESVNFICEIPKFTRKKFELATKEANNPIKQDEKKGQLREFKKGDIFFNYGCLPRTWEDPEHVHPDTGHAGDNDPLDVCEIGLRLIPTGVIRRCKVLGVLAMIDEGETDWKVVVIDEDDRWASELNDVDDVERLLPGTLDKIREWFRTYKVPDGKPENTFGFDGRFMDRAYSMKVIGECHEAWKALVSGQKGGAGEGAGAGAFRSLSYPALAQLDGASVQLDGQALQNIATPTAAAAAEDAPEF